MHCTYLQFVLILKFHVGLKQYCAMERFFVDGMRKIAIQTFAALKMYYLTCCLHALKYDKKLRT